MVEQRLVPVPTARRKTVRVLPQVTQVILQALEGAVAIRRAAETLQEIALEPACLQVRQPKRAGDAVPDLSIHSLQAGLCRQAPSLRAAAASAAHSHAASVCGA